MAEDEVMAPEEASPVPPSSDLKRKLEDLETPKEIEGQTESSPDQPPDSTDVTSQKADEVDVKRPKLDINEVDDGLGNQNGFDGSKPDGHTEKDAQEIKSVDNEPAKEDIQVPIEGAHQETDKHIPSEEARQETDKEVSAADGGDKEDVQQVSQEEPSTAHRDKEGGQQVSEEEPVAAHSNKEGAQQVSEEEPVAAHSNKEGAQQGSQDDIEADFSETHSKEATEGPSRQEGEERTSDTQTTSRKIEVPNDKVGVLIGKGGDTIRYLQYNSGARIQITRDAEADPHSTLRSVELIGASSSIDKAEKLINAVMAEADAGGSPSLVARGLQSAPTTGGGEQLEIPVPNEKVGLIIGRGGDTIKGLQAKSGARIQLIPQHLPEGDGSRERIVRVTGDKKQIEIASEMIKDVMNQTVRPSPLSGGFNQQQPYRPRGPTGLNQWGPRGPHSSQPAPYDYQHRGPYPHYGSQYPPSHYGNYPQQMAPRSNYGSGWEQRHPPSMQGPQGGGYDYYGSQGNHNYPASAPVSSYAHGPSPSSAMGPPPPQANYNYGQPQGTNYGVQGPYSRSGPPQHGYGHGYDKPKYDNPAAPQHPYPNASSQSVYPQASNQAGYGVQQQQQYGRQPSYGMPSQGPPPQSYGPSVATQPGEMPYQAPPVQSGQSYGSSVPPQQQYPYASSAPMQQAYPPYGPASGTDGYNQVPPASSASYPQQAGQPVATYGQPGGQLSSGYMQGTTPGGYGTYASTQQGYTEQPASTTAGYGYQAPQDPAYASAQPSVYSAQPSGQQGYTQPTQAQPTYDQSVPQSGTYGTAAGSVPVSYGKTVSPQPGYPQYDSTQMYAAPQTQ